MNETTINVEGFRRPFTLSVEPWAIGFQIGQSDRCEVVFRHPTVVPTVTVGMASDMLILTVYEAGCVFDFVRGGALELQMPVATI